MRRKAYLVVTSVLALAVSACNSSTEMRDPVQDASDVKDAAARDASTRDASAPIDAASRDGAAADGSSASADGSTAPNDDDGGTSGDASIDASNPGTSVTRVFVGGYGKSYPVRTYVLERATGVLQAQGNANTTLGDSPTYIAPSADGRFLYLANESDGVGVTSVAVSKTGTLSKLNLATAEDGLVFTSLDPSGKYVLSVSYNGGFVISYPVKADNSLGASVFSQDFGGSAQTHSVRVHPNGNFAYVPNKGLDKVAQFSFDKNTGKLAKLSPEFVDTGNKSGPRHIAFDKAGKFAFVMTELSSELVVFGIGADGKLSQVDKKSALPAGQTGGAGAHVLVHPNDKFVYTSNRTDNSIVVFSVASDGKVTQIQAIKTGGARPRNFDVDPDGKFLIAANQGSGGNEGSLVVFAIGDDGKLTQRGQLVTGVQEPAAVSIVKYAQ